MAELSASLVSGAVVEKLPSGQPVATARRSPATALDEDPGAKPGRRRKRMKNEQTKEAQDAAVTVKQSYSVTVENIRDFNVKMIDMARTNTEAVFGFARQLATAKTPSDIVELWTTHARKQFEMLSEQTKELTALGQKMAGDSAEPIARSVNQVFKKAS